MEEDNKTRQESCDQFLPNTEVFLECGFVFLPKVVDRHELTSAGVTHVSMEKTCFCHEWLVLVTGHFTGGTLFTLRAHTV